MVTDLSLDREVQELDLSVESEAQLLALLASLNAYKKDRKEERDGK